ncbi:MAG: cysteine desulfurase family protein [Candidatus Binatia bacterium]
MNSTSDPIYLDHNATTPLLPEVVDAMLPYLREHFGNPSSAHVFGQRAREAVERARGEVAGLLGCSPDEVIFTSGGTEANNLAIRGVTEARPDKRHIITSSIEHPATVRPCEYLALRRWIVEAAKVDRAGRVDLDKVVALVRDDTALVTIMHANNETGTMQPIAEIARIARECGAVVHTDAAQSVGKIPLHVADLGVDLLSVAGHKFGASKGVGALFVKRDTPIRPLLLGAGHERGLRPGTENVASIVGLGRACALARSRLAAADRRVPALRDRLWERLQAGIPGIRLHGHPTERLPNTLNVGFPGVRGSAVLATAPEVAASTGSACHEGDEVPSRVLMAMGFEAELALEAVRLSLGITTTQEEVERAAGALVRAWRQLSRVAR